MLLSSSPLIRSATPSTYLIQFGSVRTPTQFAASIATMETTHFAGSVTRAQFTDPVEGFTNLDQWVSRDYSVPYADLAASLATMQSINFVTWKQNFLRLDLARPGLTDMLDPTSREHFIHNIEVGAEVAYAAGFVGLLLDMEAYSGSILWNFTSLPAGPSFATYQAAYLDAAQEAMTRIEAKWPGRSPCQIIIAVSYEQLKDATDLTLLTADTYSLLPKFLDGLHDSATRSKITCLCEESYANTTQADFDYDIGLQTPPTVPWLGSSNYANVHLNGLSTWIDYPGSGFNFADPNANTMTPAVFANNLALMAPLVDRYIVVYTQEPRWPGFGSAAPGDGMPIEYINAVNNFPVS